MPACLKYTVIHCPILESIQEAPVIMVQRQKTFDVVILNFHICISSFFRGENMPHLMDFSMKYLLVEIQWIHNMYVLVSGRFYLARFCRRSDTEFHSVFLFSFQEYECYETLSQVFCATFKHKWYILGECHQWWMSLSWAT